MELFQIKESNESVSESKSDSENSDSDDESQGPPTQKIQIQSNRRRKTFVRQFSVETKKSVSPI